MRLVDGEDGYTHRLEVSAEEAEIAVREYVERQARGHPLMPRGFVVESVRAIEAGVERELDADMDGFSVVVRVRH